MRLVADLLGLDQQKSPGFFKETAVFREWFEPDFGFAFVVLPGLDPAVAEPGKVFVERRPPGVGHRDPSLTLRQHIVVG